MQLEKCCYCEAKIPETGHGKWVEHFKPKSTKVFKDLRNHWPNLLLACPQCNGKKGSKFPPAITVADDDTKVILLEDRESSALIDPSSPDPKANPENHLGFHVNIRKLFKGRIFPKRRSHRGRATITVVGLDHHFHNDRRCELLFQLCKDEVTLREADAKGHPDLVETMVIQLTMKVRPNSKYAAFARAFVRAFNLDSEFGVSIPQDSSAGEA